MKDIKITKHEEGHVKVTSTTEAAKKVFAKDKLPETFIIVASESHKILSWAVSHNLSVDSDLPIGIPSQPNLTSET